MHNQSPCLFFQCSLWRMVEQYRGRKVRPMHVCPKLSYSGSSHECFSTFFLTNLIFPVANTEESFLSQALFFAEYVHASASLRRPFRFETIEPELVFFFPTTLLRTLEPTCTDNNLKISKKKGKKNLHKLPFIYEQAMSIMSNHYII